MIRTRGTLRCAPLPTECLKPDSANSPNFKNMWRRLSDSNGWHLRRCGRLATCWVNPSPPSLRKTKKPPTWGRLTFGATKRVYARTPMPPPRMELLDDDDKDMRFMSLLQYPTAGKLSITVFEQLRLHVLNRGAACVGGDFCDSEDTLGVVSRVEGRILVPPCQFLYWLQASVLALALLVSTPTVTFRTPELAVISCHTPDTTLSSRPRRPRLPRRSSALDAPQ